MYIKGLKHFSPTLFVHPSSCFKEDKNPATLDSTSVAGFFTNSFCPITPNEKALFSRNSAFYIPQTVARHQTSRYEVRSVFCVARLSQFSTESHFAPGPNLLFSLLMNRSEAPSASSRSRRSHPASFHSTNVIGASFDSSADSFNRPSVCCQISLSVTCHMTHSKKTTLHAS